MPIYEYLCEACGRISEVMQKVSEPRPRSCPECGSKKLAKLVSRSAFQLKGGGWYSDLYASRKEKDVKKDDSAAPSGTSAPAAAASGEPKPGSSQATPAADAGKGAAAAAGGSGETAAAPSSGKAVQATKKGRSGRTGS